ncbi:MAG: MFS transporter [Dehalococcoidales bacterium]|nr:MAG: MFS transporter [Dehalococcoidales bacterium]
MDVVNLPSGKKVLSITSVVTFLGFLDTFILIPIMALYATELGASASIRGLIIGLYSIVNTPANIIFGRLIDRVGYRLPLIFGLAGDALGMFLYILCRLPFHLALVRVFHGISGALVGPATMSVFAGSDGESRARTMGIYGISLATATLVGFGLSGFIASWLGRQAVFLLGAGLLAIATLLGLLLPGIRPAVSTAARTSFSQSLGQVTDLFKRKGLSTAYISIFAQYFTFGGVVTLLPGYLENLGMEDFHVGMLLATFAITFIITQFPSGALSDRIGRLLPVVIGLGLGIVSLVVLPSLTTFPLLAGAMALYGIGYGLLFPSISALIVDHTGNEERGLATGVFHALLTAGVAIGAPVMGLVEEGVGLETGLVIAPSVMFIALVVALVDLRRR